MQNAKRASAARCILHLAFCMTGVAVLAQQPVFHTEANYVRVDVYPTAAGMPVGDLQMADFDLLEDGKVQKIDQFERIVIRPRAATDARRDPNTVAESRAALANSRARVFVLFLDAYHVGGISSRAISKPLVDTLDNLIGEDDLVGVMTPDMSALDVTFARKTTTVKGILDRYWWGERDIALPKDPVEQSYCNCYQPGPPPDTVPCGFLARELIDRRHEKKTLDALEDLVRFLRDQREERKAIITISEGWRLFRPSQALMPDTSKGVPGMPPIGVDPGSGKITTGKNPNNPYAGSQYTCDRDRMNLAQIDDEVEFRQLLDEANRANASFYPVDPRGLAVFDSAINEAVPLDTDASRLRSRIESLRTLALNTDGVAVVNTNDLASGLKRIVTDLSSYYLLGYYSTGKLDGRFHAIKVRVKRPGVDVRARRGFLAPTAEEAANRNATVVTTPAEEAAAADVREIEDAVGTLATFSRDVPMRVQIAAGWKPDQSAGVWAVGEVSATEDWKAGGDADITLATTAGATLATQHAHLDPGVRTFRVGFTAASPLGAGDYALRVTSRNAGGAIPHTDLIRFALPPAPGALGAIYIRRGPSSGNKEVVTADLRYRRSDRIRVEVPGVSPTATARLLDRRGKPLAVPLTTATRNDADGTRWLTAEVALAPLAAADYVIEFTGEAGRAGGAGGKRTLVAFRVVP